MKFSEMPYTRPDPEEIIALMKELIERLKNAESYAAARAVFLEKPFRRKFRREVLLFLETRPDSTAPEMRLCSMKPHSDEST